MLPEGGRENLVRCISFRELEPHLIVPFLQLCGYLRRQLTQQGFICRVQAIQLLFQSLNAQASAQTHDVVASPLAACLLGIAGPGIMRQMKSFVAAQAVLLICVMERFHLLMSDLPRQLIMFDLHVSRLCHGMSLSTCVMNL